MNLNHDVTIFSNRSYINDEVLNKKINVVPIFSISPYSNLKKDPYTGELDEYIRFTQIYSQELQKIPVADLIIVPTMFSFLLNAFTVNKTKTPIAACIHFGPDFKNINNGKLRWRIAFRNARGSLLMNMGGLEKVNYYDYLPLTFNKKFHVFPIPLEGSQLSKQKNKIETVGFFGDQRGEKGTGLLEPLIKFLVSKNIHVIVHDSSSKISANHPSVTVINYVESLANEIAKCDLVILPYDQKEYSHKGSGILFEAIASGVPALVPFNTTLAKHVEDTGAGVTFFDNDIESICEAFETLQSTYGDIKKNASVASKKWKQVHGIKNFVKSLIEPTNFNQC
jgi:glycosyltransferase involved in cell wall biosynthesis